MKKMFVIVLLMILGISLIGCNNVQNDLSKDTLSYPEYEEYYKYKGAFKGVEIYCFEKDGKYYSILMPGTNRLKSVGEVKELQDNLPCPVEIMKEILATYSEDDRKNVFVTIVSNPPTEAELSHSVENTEENKKLLILMREKLGLVEINTDIENEMKTPIEIEELNELDSGDVISITGIYSLISSYIFHTTNKSLIRYICNTIKNIEFTDVLTNSNRDEVAQYGDRTLTLNLNDNKSFLITLTKNNNIYLEYCVSNENTFDVLWAYKAYQPEEYDILANFQSMGAPSDEWWCGNPVVTHYLDCDISPSNQEYIVKSYIRNLSPLRYFYEDGDRFSGSIRSYFGKYNEYYAVIVDGCGFAYTQALRANIIDGVKSKYGDGNSIMLVGENCYSLQKALEEKIISYNDLVTIASLLDG